MTPLLQRRQTCRCATRRGVAALFVLICLSFATVVATLLMQAVVAERKYVARLAQTHQAEWLVEAGVDRAVAQLARSSRYTGETWPISATRLGRARNAVVHIEIKQDTFNPKLRNVHVTADLQEGDTTTRVEAAKEMNVMVAVD
jgi:type II secretory pathway component PulK